MTATHIQMTASGPTVSRIIPGLMRLNSWDMSDGELLDWIKGCLELGVTTFDHADIYGGHTCEEIFGRALALEPSIRDQIQLVTKCGIKPKSPNRPDHWINHYDTEYDYIIWSAENSLKTLQTDHLDVLLIHRPDPLMDADEIAGAFMTLKEQGRVRHFGVSNFTPSQFDLVQSRLPFQLATNQVEFSVVHMEPMHDGTFDQLQKQRVAPMVWSPVGGGGLFRAETDQARRLKQTMRKIADRYDAEIDQIAIAWILAHPVRALPVLGTGKLERIRRAVDAEAIELDRQEWFAIWEASAGHSVP